MRKTLRSPQHELLRQLLVAARKSRGETQAEVARRLKKPQSFVAKYEAGERRLDIVEFLAVTQALHCDPVPLLRKLKG